MADTVFIKSILPSAGQALNKDVRLNLDELVRGINAISNGLTNFNQLNVGTPLVSNGEIRWFNDYSNYYFSIIPGGTITQNTSIRFPNPGTATSNFVLSEGTQSLNGVYTFTQPVVNQTFNWVGSVNYNIENDGGGDSYFRAYVNNTTGDPYINFLLNDGVVTQWSLGTDNSDSNKFKISNAFNLGSSDYLTISTAGLVTVPGTLTVTGVATLTSAPVLSALTVTTVPYISAGKVLTSSAVTPTELGFLSGVTSAIQTQLNAKAPTASPTFTGTITTPLTASRALATGASSELAVSATTATELAFVSGVTSAIQTQLTAKAPLASPTFTGVATFADGLVSAPGVTVGQSGVGLYRAGNNDIRITANGDYIKFAGSVITAFLTMSMSGTKITSLANGSASTDAAAFGQLKVIQIISGTTTSVTSTTSSTYQNTALAATITPTSASNKIFVLVSGALETNVAANNAQLSLKRGTTEVTGGGLLMALRPSASATTRIGGSFMYLDSPATTAATTYTVVLLSSDNASTSRFPSNAGDTGSILLVEVVA